MTVFPEFCDPLLTSLRASNASRGAPFPFALVEDKNGARYVTATMTALQSHTCTTRPSRGGGQFS